MNLVPVLSFAKDVLQKAVRPGDIVIDATVGNGHDTVFLADLVGPSGRVYGFDIQEDAILSTNRRLTEKGSYDRVSLFLESHANVKTAIPEDVHGTIKAAIFNLGYLPGSDKQVITRSDSTIHAIKELFDILTAGGLIVLVVYHGHEGGKEEKEALLSYLSSLDQKKAHVLHYQFINQKNDPPFVMAVEKR
ncbi:class I SAM-dependent methyltransferase [Alkalihalobacillus sp. AL-G]|uniref:class I SAM-dependent methyltransferase n=1 Tax=Alkalihalobacillus sp. AL-G TaxID=2926399 RepID=UPI00272CFAFB|nr:class I SAM-dependent methyltransferase [Alkalihalobacillus sp. AL-G]WLD92450.1 methyltransferase domain-containing protein [Alkalihalobacillus sp. AL-G]